MLPSDRDRSDWEVYPWRQRGLVHDGAWLQHGKITAGVGWKFHVSCREGSLRDLARSVVPYLIQNNHPFKIASSDDAVAAINRGLLGASQVGKVLTIYPNQDSITQSASDLTTCLRDIRGPVIDNEIQVAPPLPLFMRYGSFVEQFILTPAGTTISAISAPDGSLILDDRSKPMHLVLGLSPPIDGKLVLPLESLDERYFVTGTFLDKGYKRTMMAVDLDKGRPCVLRYAKRHCAIDALGRDAVDRIDHEVRILQALRGLRSVGEVYNYSTNDQFGLLALSHLEGETLHQYVRRNWLRREHLADVALKLAQVVQEFHSRNILILDLSPANVLLRKDFSVSLIDFELCCFTDERQSAGFGTQGYSSPNVIRGGLASEDDDLYSLAANLAFIFFGVDLSVTPNAPLVLTEFSKSTTLGRGILAPLLTCDSTSSAARLSQSIARLQSNTARAVAVGRPFVQSRENSKKWQKKLSQILTSVVAGIQSSADLTSGDGVWKYPTVALQPEYGRWINSGDSGVGLGLLRLGHALKISSAVEVAIGVGDSLYRRSSDFAVPGLFIGEAGVGWFYLSLYMVTKDQTWLRRAREVGQRLRTMDLKNPDLFHGAAGIGLFLLWLHDIESDTALRRHIAQIADWLMRASIQIQNDKFWTIPPEYGTLSERTFLGLAHGAAGIGLFFAKCSLSLQHEASKDWAVSIAQSLQHHKIQFRKDDLADWPDGIPGESWGGVWCHGSSGIALFLRACWQATNDTKWLSLARAACKSGEVASGLHGATQCHGIAGILEATMSVSEANCIDKAGSQRTVRNLAEALVSRFLTDGGGDLSFSSDLREVTTNAYMIGASGTAASLGRYLSPHLLGHYLDGPSHSFRSH